MNKSNKFKKTHDTLKKVLDATDFQNSVGPFLELLDGEYSTPEELKQHFRDIRADILMGAQEDVILLTAATHIKITKLSNKQ